jgi:hypothetical protein
MSRTVNEEAYDAKRNEILDFAQALIYSKGHERMTIQDLLDGLRISRGARVARPFVGMIVHRVGASLGTPERHNHSTFQTRRTF